VRRTSSSDEHVRVAAAGRHSRARVPHAVRRDGEGRGRGEKAQQPKNLRAMCEEEEMENKRSGVSCTNTRGHGSLSRARTRQGAESLESGKELWLPS